MSCRDKHGLTLRQARFVREYLVDGNGAQAAIRAGYSIRAAKEVAYRLVTTAHVRAEIERLARAEAGELGVSRSTIISELWAAYQLARASGSPSGMISAIRELAKICGLYPPVDRRPAARRRQGEAHCNLSELSDIELMRILEGRPP